MPKVKIKPIPNLTDSQKERFWRYVNIADPDSCWPWNRFKDKNGYGIFALSKDAQYRATRIALHLSTGEDPAEKYVLHRCDNPPCCNPSHLFLGTALQNCLDMHTKKRRTRAGKLNHGQVLEVRNLFATGNFTKSELGRRFGIDATSIFKIVTRRSYKYL